MTSNFILFFLQHSSIHNTNSRILMLIRRPKYPTSLQLTLPLYLQLTLHRIFLLKYPRINRKKSNNLIIDNQTLLITDPPRTDKIIQFNNIPLLQCILFQEKVIKYNYICFCFEEDWEILICDKLRRTYV